MPKPPKHDCDSQCLADAPKQREPTVTPPGGPSADSRVAHAVMVALASEVQQHPEWR